MRQELRIEEQRRIGVGGLECYRAARLRVVQKDEQARVAHVLGAEAWQKPVHGEVGEDFVVRDGRGGEVALF